MDEPAIITARLSAALHTGATAGDRLLALHFTADSVASVAALLMLFGLAYFGLRRRDFEFRGLMWVLAAAFLALAMSYGFTAWSLWHPDRWLEGAFRAAAAVAISIAAISLLSSLPRALRLPSPRQLRRANANLTRETWEQQRLLREAREEASLFRSAFEHADVGLAMLSPAGRWVQMNDRMAELLGRSRVEILKRTPHQVIGIELQPGEEERELRDGRWLAWQLRLTKDGAGNEKPGLVQCRDVTSIQVLERELADARDELRTLAEKASATEQANAERERDQAEKGAAEAMLADEAERLRLQARQLSMLGERITEMIGVDEGTGLASSHDLMLRFEQALARARRYGHGFAVLALAADPMEADGPESDSLIGVLGAVLRSELRDTDAAGRCDSQRICVLLAMTSLQGASTVADRIRHRLGNSPVLARDGRTVGITCCIGAAEWKAGQTLGEVMRDAGDALRDAQRNGRNRISLGVSAVAAKPSGP